MAARHPDETASVNHSWHAPLRTGPISVNIVTKLTGEGWDTAVVQLGTWVAAHFTKLEHLIHDFDGDADQMPFLPLIIVQGHDWYFLAASRGKYGQTNIWLNEGIGSTSNALGVYQIITTIQYLARWTETVYRPWFYTNALGMQLRGTEAPATATTGATAGAASTNLEDKQDQQKESKWSQGRRSSKTSSRKSRNYLVDARRRQYHHQAARRQ